MRIYQIQLQTCQTDKRLERGTRFITPFERPVEQGPTGCVQDGLVGLLADTVYKGIGIIGRLADQRDDTAIGGINRHHRTGPLTQSVPGRTLDGHVYRQHQIRTRDCVLAIEHPQHPTADVGFHLLIPTGSMQFGFPELLNTNFSDDACTTVIALIHPGDIPFIQTPDITQHVGQQLTIGIIPGQVRHDIRAFKTMPVHRKPGNLLFTEIEFQRDGVKHAVMTPGLVEAVPMLIVELYKRRQFVQQGLKLLHFLGYYFQPVGGKVLRYYPASPVIDQSPVGNHWTHTYPVAFRARGKLLMCSYLQPKVASEQAQHTDHNHKEPCPGPAFKKQLLFARVLHGLFVGVIDHDLC